MTDVIDYIKNVAKLAPQQVAVADKGKKISYSEFWQLVNKISNSLMEVAHSARVIVDLSQGIEAYALIVSVMNVGGCYCPLNPEAPRERKMQIINDFQPQLIVSNRADLSDLGESIKIISFSNLMESGNRNEVKIDYKEEDVVYVIYTSGSTGMPKGVEIRRKSLNKFLEWSIPTYGATGKDIWGQFSFLSFDLSIVDIFTCLCSGATLLSMNDILAKKYRPSSLVESEKITIWHSVPSAVDFMIVNEKSKEYDFTSLRLMSFCGEPLRKHHVEFLFKKNRTLKVFNTYGPTEGTLFCTCQELTIGNYNIYSDYTISIGASIPGWGLHLIKTEEQDIHEVIIYGNYIGKGYLRIDNEAKFTTIFLDGEKVSAFMTGDLVRQNNGSIYFEGRKDRQVKIKGHRIELDEIDFRVNEFTKLPSITLDYNNALYSFIESNQEIDIDALKQSLKNMLEPWKLPGSIRVINEIPRNENQKPDRTKLIELIANG